MQFFDFYKNQSVSPSKVENNSITRQFIPLQIEQVVQETTDTISVYLNLPPHLSSLFSYQAGQYITLQYPLLSETLLRSYSISSCPHTDNFFRITIKIKPQGKLSEHLVKNLQAQQTLVVFPPTGDFTLNQSNISPHYAFIAGGSGISPIISMIKTLLSTSNAFIYLLYSSRTHNNIIYLNELNNLQQQYPKRFTVNYILSTPAIHFDSLKGRFTAIDFADNFQKYYSTTIHSVEFFLCGPEAMMHEAEKALIEYCHIHPKKVHLEYFTFDTPPQLTQINTDSELPFLNPNIVDQPIQNEASTTIILGGLQHVIIAPQHITLLDACLNADLDVPFSCEEGTCSSCKAKVIYGKTTLNNQYALSTQQLQQGYILTCCAYPLTADIGINFDI